jgi:hypothetical protein
MLMQPQLPRNLKHNFFPNMDVIDHVVRLAFLFPTASRRDAPDATPRRFKEAEAVIVDGDKLQAASLSVQHWAKNDVNLGQSR